MECLLGLLAGLVILTGFLIWRLSEGPVPLNFLTPRLLAAFGSTNGTVDIGQTLLVWDEARSSLDLRVRDLTFRSPRGGTSITLPETNLTLSVAELIGGRIVVTELEVLNASLTLLRLRDGRLAGLQPPPDPAAPPPAEAAPAEPAPAEPAPAEPAPAEPAPAEPAPAEPAPGEAASGTADEPTQSPAFALLDRLLAEDSGDALAGLEAVRLIDADVVLDDRKQGLTWSFPAREIVLRRDQRGLSGNAELSVELEGSTAAFNLVFVYNVHSDLLDLSLQFSDLDLAKLPDILPELAPLKALETKAGGSLNATIGRGAELALIDFDLTLSRGTFYPDQLSAVAASQATPPLAFSGGTLTGLYDGGRETLELRAGKLLVGTPEAPGPVLQFSGQLQSGAPAPGQSQMSLNLALDRLATDDLASYWPAGLAQGGRDWTLANISGGEIDDLKLAMTGSFGTQLSIESLEGTFAFKGLSVAYLYPMPPITATVGTAHIDLKGLTFDVTSGQLTGLALGPAQVVIDGFDQPQQAIRIDAKGSGPIPDLLALLEHPRLNLLQKLDVSAKGSAGTADFTLSFAFPLVSPLGFDQVVMKGAAALKGVRMANIVGGEGIAADSADLTVDNTALTLKGRIALAGSEFDVDWLESFTDSRKSKLQARSDRVEAETVRRLLPAMTQPLEGSLGVDLTIDGDLSSRGTLVADLDLKRTGISAPYLDWTKQAGEAASAKLRAIFEKGRLAAFEDVVITGPGLDLTGRMSFGAGGAVTEVRLSKAKLRDYDLTDIVATPVVDSSGVTGWRVSIGGGRVDARPVLEQISLSGAAVKETMTPVTIESARLEQVTLPGGRLDQVQFSGLRGPKGIERLQLTGELVDSSAGGVLEVSLQPNDKGHRQLQLKAANMGALLRVLGIADTVVGGTLRIDLTSVGDSEGAALSGKVEGKSFRLVKAPTLAKILMAATLVGIGDALSTEGIAFERLTGDITLDKGVLSSQLLRAYGGAIGITAKGQVDFERDVINIEGTVVPAYSINRVLGQIPIIGWILTGGEGGGLLAVTYSVSGTVGDPQVSVNPLSALTPGFLRGLFDLFDTGDGSEAPPPSLYPDGPTR